MKDVQNGRIAIRYFSTRLLKILMNFAQLATCLKISSR